MKKEEKKDRRREKKKKEKEAKEKEEAKEGEKKEEEEYEPISGSAKTLCIPFDQPELPEGTKCFSCGVVAKSWCLLGRSY